VERLIIIALHGICLSKYWNHKSTEFHYSTEKVKCTKLRKQKMKIYLIFITMARICGNVKIQLSLQVLPMKY